MNNDLFSVEELQQIVVTTIQASGDPNLLEEEINRAIEWAHDSRMRAILLNMVLDGEMGIDVTDEALEFCVFPSP